MRFTACITQWWKGPPARTWPIFPAAEHRGTAYGIYNTAVGIMALPASLIAGILWQGAGRLAGMGAPAPFLFGSAMAIVAVLLTLFWLPRLAKEIAPMEARMMRSIWRIVRNADLAEDTLQDALAVIWKKRHQVRRHPNPPALILKICLNAAYDSLRRLERMQHRTDGSPLEDVPAPCDHDAARDLEARTRATGPAGNPPLPGKERWPS